MNYKALKHKCAKCNRMINIRKYMCTQCKEAKRKKNNVILTKNINKEIKKMSKILRKLESKSIRR